MNIKRGVSVRYKRNTKLAYSVWKNTSFVRYLGLLCCVCLFGRLGAWCRRHADQLILQATTSFLFHPFLESSDVYNPHPPSAVQIPPRLTRKYYNFYSSSTTPKDITWTPNCIMSTVYSYYAPPSSHHSGSHRSHSHSRSMSETRGPVVCFLLKLHTSSNC